MLSDNPIVYSISGWFRRNFSEPAAVSLFLVLLFFFLFIEFFGNFFMPVFVSVVFAYLLASPVRWLMQMRVPHVLSVVIVYCLFLALFVVAFLGLTPVLWKQLQALITELPNAFNHSKDWVAILMKKYPALFTDLQVQNIMGSMQQFFAKSGQYIVQFGLQAIPNVIQLILYFVLVPLLVYFFLMDRRPIVDWCQQYMPKNRMLVDGVWREVNQKIGSYIRGRVLEVILVGIVTSLVFYVLGMPYAFLLGLLVGLSVIIPYVGAVVVTVPVIVVALMEWGFSMQFTYLLLSYGIIILLDANLLVPLLFAETMELHPVVIILSVLVFGSIWSFWGVFFAIPLAMLFSVVLKSWPSVE